MKQVYHIRKSRLYASTDYSALLSGVVSSGCKLEKIDAGEITIDTGAVCFFDPYRAKPCEPFARRLPAGKYAAFMYRMQTEKGARIALMGLDGGNLRRAVQWELAFACEKELCKLQAQPNAVGTAIDSGLGALCDSSAFNAFSQVVEATKDTFHPLDGIAGMDGNCALVCSVKDIRLPVCSTGWGEGYYPSYFGIDADGAVCGIVCDFCVLPAAKKKESNETVTIETEGDETDAFVADPRKSDSENNILLYTGVIEGGRADSAHLLRAYSRRGYAYHKTGRYTEALADYLQAIDLGKQRENKAEFSKHAWSLYENAAGIYRETGQTDNAVALYREACKLTDMFDGGAYVGLIDVYREAKDHAAALAAADEMVAARPHDPTAYIKRSEIFMACEEYEKALDDFTVLIDVFKLNECILEKALCLRHLGRAKEALAVLDGYLAEGRANEVYYGLRADIEMADNNMAAAYVDARNAFDANPDYPETLERLIEWDGLLFRRKNVVKWVSRYIALRPHAQYGYSVRADAYMKMGEYEEALADYLQLVRLSKDDPKHCALLIRAALCCGNKGLVKRYQKLLRRSSNAYYIYAAGLSLMQQRKFGRAQRYIASASMLIRSDIIVSSLIDCFVANGNFAKADAAMKEYAQLADGEEVFMKHALIAKARGIPAEAIEREYVHRYLGDCSDAVLTEKVHAYFASL